VNGSPHLHAQSLFSTAPNPLFLRDLVRFTSNSAPWLPHSECVHSPSVSLTFYLHGVYVLVLFVNVCRRMADFICRLRVVAQGPLRESVPHSLPSKHRASSDLICHCLFTSCPLTLAQSLVFFARRCICVLPNIYVTFTATHRLRAFGVSAPYIRKTSLVVLAAC